MKSIVRGVVAMDVVWVLCLVGLVFIVWAEVGRARSYEHHQQVAYASAKNAAMGVQRDWEPVIDALVECHQRLGLDRIDHLSDRSNTDLYLCPNVVVALRAQRQIGGSEEMMLKHIKIKDAYAQGFWQGAAQSPAVYAAAKGYQYLAPFLDTH